VRESGLKTGAYEVTAVWDEAAEQEFSAFVQAIGVAREKRGFKLYQGLKDPTVNPLFTEEDKELDLMVDCANLPYFVRVYFAYKTHRPFSFQSNKGKRYKEGNRPEEFGDFSQYKDFTSLASATLSAVSSAHFRMHAGLEGTDTYPIDIDSESLVPGTVYYDPNGHVALVYRVDRDTGDVYMLDGHPDGTMSKKVWGASYAVGTARFGGGFKAWRHYRIDVLDPQKGSFRITRALNRESRHYSDTAQYKGMYWVGEFDMTYHEWVRAMISKGGAYIDPIDLFHRTLDSLCGDLQDRVKSVDEAVAAGIDKKPHPADLPWNIYGASGTWEDYSSPGRDARLRFKFKELKEFVEKSVRWSQNGDKRLLFQGGPAALVAAYRQLWYAHLTASECIIEYTRSNGQKKSLTLTDILERLWDLSFDPYHCPELRWGAPRKTADGLPTEEISSCPSDGRKAYWYKEEFRLRNRTTRLIDKATATHRGPEKPENVDTPGLLECYQTNGPQYGLCNPALPLQANPPPRTTQVSGF
jgi:hypothetical protein